MGVGACALESVERKTVVKSLAKPGQNVVIQEDAQAIAEELSRELTALAGSTMLVTGGNGFLCSYFLETIAHANDSVLDSPCNVICVDNLRTGLSERVAHLDERAEFQFVSHDISEPLEIDRPVHWIIHGAGIASPTFYRKFPLQTVDVNVTGTRRVLEIARQHPTKSILYISTSEIYGDPDPRFIPTPEDYRGNVSCNGPRACYDESKRMGEALCGIYRSLYNAPVKTARPFNVYGPGQRLDDRRIVPDLMSAALRREPLVLFSDGRATRAFCYIRDAIRAMFNILLSDADGEAFNVGNDEREISITEFASELSEIAGPPALPVVHRASRDPHYLTDNPQRRCPDLTKLRGRFNWEPKVLLREGLRRTLRSYQERT